MIEIFQRAPCSSSTLTNCATVERFLADRDINAIQLDLLVGLRVERLLVEDGVRARSRSLPVWRSPMNQFALGRGRSGISASIALRPVAIGSLTDLRGMMPGALDVDAHPLVGLDRTLAVDRIAERVDDRGPSRPLADGGLSTMARVRLTVWPSLISRSAPKITMPTFVGLEIQSHAGGCRSRTRPSRRPGRCRGP